MRYIEVPVYVGVMKGTENYEQPVMQVLSEPFSGKSFESYYWYRATLKVPIQGEVVEIQGVANAFPVEEK